jgi:hypothetical protein
MTRSPTDVGVEQDFGIHTRVLSTLGASRPPFGRRGRRRLRHSGHGRVLKARIAIQLDLSMPLCLSLVMGIHHA